MSLLLEALRKAEKAKEDAQRGAPESALDETSGSAGDRKVLTRAELPDISRPLSIESSDLEPTLELTADATADAGSTASSALS